MTPPTEPATFPACPRCGAPHGPAVRCDGAVNAAFHVLASNQAIVRANAKRGDRLARREAIPGFAHSATAHRPLPLSPAPHEAHQEYE